MALLDGGAKQSIHYTDITPALVVFAITAGGNHIFNHVLGPNKLGLPDLKRDAFKETLQINGDQLLSPVYIGWTQGYLDEERAKLEGFLKEETSSFSQQVQLMHPRTAFRHLIEHFKNGTENASWLE